MGDGSAASQKNGPQAKAMMSEKSLGASPSTRPGPPATRIAVRTPPRRSGPAGIERRRAVEGGEVEPRMVEPSQKKADTSPRREQTGRAAASPGGESTVERNAARKSQRRRTEEEKQNASRCARRAAHRNADGEVDPGSGLDAGDPRRGRHPRLHPVASACDARASSETPVSVTRQSSTGIAATPRAKRTGAA